MDADERWQQHEEMIQALARLWERQGEINAEQRKVPMGDGHHVRVPRVRMMHEQVQALPRRRPDLLGYLHLDRAGQALPFAPGRKDCAAAPEAGEPRCLSRRCLAKA